MIELQDLVKHFGDLAAVDHLDLTVRSGEFFCVLGPNAAGKTTTIKMIVGLIRPTSGTIRVCGMDVQEQPVEVRRRMAYVPDFPFLYDKLTPMEFFDSLAGCLVWRKPKWMNTPESSSRASALTHTLT